MPVIGQPAKISHTNFTRDALRRIRRLEKRPIGGFDPNEDPIIIGAGANTTDGGTPDNPGASAFTNLVVIGDGASGGAGYQVVIGSGASATGDSTLAIGIGATAVGDSSTAVGETTSTYGLRATAVGTSASADGDDATALGGFASASYVHSTAVGRSAATTKDNQIMLGTTADFVEIPGNGAANGLVLKDTVTGTRYIAQITSGAWAFSAAP